MSQDPQPDPSTSQPAPAWSDPQADLQERLRRATVGEYDILAQLGFGGMAGVYLAHDLALDRRVAVKVMSPAMVYGPGLVDRFRLEAKTAAALSHPNIIPIYAVREADGLLFFVMKLVEGTSLDAIISEVGPLPIAMVEAIVAQVGGALGYAHRHGVVHRDIKPANILLDEEGWVVVTDFGIAKVTDASALTMTGVAVGTPTYMSPEQCAGDVITGASDQYSLGIVTYEMLTGRPPFVDQSIPQLMIGHTTRMPPSITAVRPDCPAPLRVAVERMLAKNPSDRFPSMEEAVTTAEARPLAPNDATHGTMVALAKNSSTRHLIAQVRTPRSPVPLLRQSGAVASTPPARRGRSGLLLGSGLAVGIAATALVAWLLRPAPPLPADGAVEVAAADPAPPTGTGVPASSDPVAPRAPVPPAAAAVRTPPAPPPPATEDPRPAALPPAATPSAAAPAMSQAAAAADTAPAIRSVTPEQAPVTPPADTVTRAAPPPPPPPPPAPSPAPAPDPSVEVASVIQAYARALEAGRIDLATRLFPTMPADQRQGLEAFYRDGGSMQTRWQVTDIAVAGSTATLRVVGSNVVRTARTGPSEQRVALRARLERGPDGWHLISLAN